MEIERKFLVRDAHLRDIPGLQLLEIKSTYLDIPKLMDHGASLGIILGEESGPREIRVSKVTHEEQVEYWMTVKVGGATLSRAESASKLDEATYNKVVKNFGESSLSKKRFKFNYLRKTFELDVIPDARMMILEIELDTEKQPFVVPPFVNIIREVTGEKKFYSANIASALTLRS